MLNVDLNNTKTKIQYKVSVDSQLAIIESWMTSLKKHTIDYNENTFLNVKNIPSRYTSWCGSELITEMGILNNNDSSNDNNNNRTVVNYRKNDQLIKDNVTTKRLCQYFNINVSDENYNCTNLDKSNSYHLKNDHKNSKSDNNNLILFNQNYNKTFDLNICLHNLCLSFSLNQIVISYDDKLKFLVTNRIKYNITGPKQLVKKYFELIKLIDSIKYKNSNNYHNFDSNKKINYLKQNNTIENNNCKKNILDYELKRVSINNITDVNLTIDDFVIKTSCDYKMNVKKNFSDFCLAEIGDSANKMNTNICEKTRASSLDSSPVADNRVLRRDTATKNRIKNLNVNRKIGHQGLNEHLYNHESEQEEDYIYQPIWKCRTIGNSPDADHTEISMQANLAIPDDVSDSDNWSNAEQDFAYHNFSYIDENENSLEYIDAGSIGKESDGHNNNSDSNNNNNNNNNSCDNKIISSPYSKVIIFYKINNHLLNEIKQNNNRTNINNQMNKVRQDKLFNKYKTNNFNKTIKNILNSNLPKNVEKWQLNLLNYNLIEDEEDVIMTERSVIESVSPDHTSKIGELGKGPSFTATKIFGLANSKSIQNTENIAGNDYPNEGKFTPNKFVDESEYNYGPLKNSTESETTSIKSVSDSLKGSPKYSPTNSEKKIDKIKPKDKEKKKEKDKVFGVDLDKVELDPDLGVPKFIVECIKIVEEDENIETNGIYRASGNKNNIENIKKKMNEKRYMSKESKYTFLQNQDLHTITGALKLFFRETSDLIPEEVFDKLPKNLGCKENLETVKTQINNLDQVRFETLKYLMKHLRKVHENNSTNLMTSSNLSIIWGASLFTKSVNSIMSLIENDIMNRNVLIRVLIDNYDYVFNENLFSDSPNNVTTIDNT